MKKLNVANCIKNQAHLDIHTANYKLKGIYLEERLQYFLERMQYSLSEWKDMLNEGNIGYYTLDSIASLERQIEIMTAN